MIVEAAVCGPLTDAAHCLYSVACTDDDLEQPIRLMCVWGAVQLVRLSSCMPVEYPRESAGGAIGLLADAIAALADLPPDWFAQREVRVAVAIACAALEWLR